MNPAGALQAHYDAMWTGAIDAVRSGDVDLDATLAADADAGADPRRGLTVIARPDAALAARLSGMIDGLAAIETAQHCQPVTDLHVTMLSLFTVCAAYRDHLARLDDYRAAVRGAVHAMPAFDIDFHGVTVSRGAVLAQGFPRDGTLETLRARLRAGLRARGLDGALDRRYTLVTAHATLMRFIAPLSDPARLAAMLTGLRAEPLGTLRVGHLELVLNDWTMRTDRLRRIDAFDLA